MEEADWKALIYSQSSAMKVNKIDIGKHMIQGRIADRLDWTIEHIGETL